MTGSSVFDYVHAGDHAELAEQLGLTLANQTPAASSTSQQAANPMPPSPASATGSVDDANSCMNPDGILPLITILLLNNGSVHPKNGLKWTEMDWNGLKWTEMDWNWLKLTEIEK